MGLFKQVSFEEEIMKHMQAKYGEEFIKTFTVVATGCESTFDRYEQARGKTTLFPEEIIDIYGYPRKFFKDYEDKDMRYKSKEYVIISDNYVEIYKQKELQQYFEKKLNDIYKKMRVSSIGVGSMKQCYGMSNVFDLNTNIKDLISVEKHGMLTVIIDVEDKLEEKEEKFMNVIDLLRKERSEIWLAVYYCNNIQRVKETQYYRGVTIIDSDFCVNKIRWEKIQKVL